MDKKINLLQRKREKRKRKGSETRVKREGAETREEGW